MAIPHEGYPLILVNSIEKPAIFQGNQINILNISKDYPALKFDWNEEVIGKLWAYNLNYFDFLLQRDLSSETGIQIIQHFINNLPDNKTGLDPYPIALRGINWIKYLSKKTENPLPLKSKSDIDSSLYAQYLILLDNLEYHLLGNHLLENGFSLLFGAFYFEDEHFFLKGSEIIKNELKEQILNDGGHFERSPMYHQILLDRLLDCINLCQNNHRFPNQDWLLYFMKEKANKMMHWLKSITFSNSEIPLFNDAAPGIAPSTAQLCDYAKSLGIDTAGSQSADLDQSGYRRFDSVHYECILDIGKIGPTYQPGHAHADTFNFVLHVNSKPLVVDTGVSTYERNTTRLMERGTSAHNTVTIQDMDSSEVWSSFRVANRANVKVILDTPDHIVAQHDGYRKYGTIHQREWKFYSDYFEIIDSLIGEKHPGKAYFHIKSLASPVKIGNSVATDLVEFHYENSDDIDVKLIQIPNGFNAFSDGYLIEIAFRNHLKTTIKPLLK